MVSATSVETGMFTRDFLFLSGECRVTLKAVFSTEKWEHTASASGFMVVRPGVVRRVNRSREEIKGALFYADMDDKDLERSNLQIFHDTGLPCWPPPGVLLRMIDRSKVLQECYRAGLVDHEVSFPKTREEITYFPSVLKLGNVHRGEGKLLLRSPEDIPECLDPCSSLEPYFKGSSVRVFVIGDTSFCAEVTNEGSWVKNSPGADASLVPGNLELVLHARSVALHFGLELAGVDYIVGPEGFHFLEINQFPGFYGLDEVEEEAFRFFKSKMAEVSG